MKVFLLLLVVVVIAGCGGLFLGDRIQARYEAKLEAWEQANPSVAPSPEVMAALKAEATAEIEAERAQEKEEALAKAGEAVANFSTGNVVGGIIMLAGAIGSFFGVKAAVKAKAAVKGGGTV